MGLFGWKNKIENNDARDSKGALKRPADEITEEILLKIVGGGGDPREEISEDNANPRYAAGEMNDTDGWD